MKEVIDKLIKENEEIEKDKKILKKHVKVN